MAESTLLRMARELLVISRRIDIDSNRMFCTAEIEVVADRWACEQRRRHRAKGPRWSRELFCQTAISWLRFLGALRQPEPKPSPFADQLAAFAAHATTERGLSTVTVRLYCWHMQKFLEWRGGENATFSQVSIQEVHAFLTWTGEHGWCRVSVASRAKALRAFFRYAAARGWCTAQLAASIDGPRLFQHETLPVGPAWADVQRLLAGVDGNQAQDIRDRAILLLLAVYGLRSGEVRRLCLQDVDWEHDRLMLVRPKQRRVQQYPLTPEVGEAILRYLQEARPLSPRREVFLTLKAPFRPLSPGALHHLVSSRWAALDICLPHRGPHALRHACAGHLVAEGFSLKQIGDHLGHRSDSATRIYAKVDLPGLREVADFDLGGLR